ncbi:phage portal protein [Shouchella patagoniensis]|uniref:phage portal protein n=1 Tax=Shouchella patagoniensis TaxID=228576 RepID=UPI000994A152|nr:phage portal protein [Shouchella patagoniensis]
MLLRKVVNSIQDWEKPLWNAWGAGYATHSGEIITADTSLRISAIYAAINIKANSVAKLPLQMYSKKENKRTREQNHSLSDLIENRPNTMQSSYMFKQTLIAHRHIHGAAYVLPVFNRRGKIESLELLNPNYMDIVQHHETKEYWFVYADGHQPKAFHPSEIVYLPYFTPDGITALSPIQVARETSGQMQAGKKFMSGFYKNGAATNVKITTPETLSSEARERVVDEYMKSHGGASNSGRPLVASGGMDIDSLTMPIADMQYVENMKFNITEIARIFNVPPHMLAELERSTNNNIEHQGRDFIANSIQPELTAIEEEFNYKLFTTRERQHLYFKFNLRSALRSNDETRALYYEKMIKNGVYSINDILELEDMDGIDGGDTHRVDLNSIALDVADEYQLAKAGALKGGENNE